MNCRSLNPGGEGKTVAKPIENPCQLPNFAQDGDPPRLSHAPNERLDS